MWISRTSRTSRALINHSKNVAIDHVSVNDSGSRNAKGRNNTSGGILLEEGTEQFSVTDSTFRNIRGNGGLDAFPLSCRRAIAREKSCATSSARSAAMRFRWATPSPSKWRTTTARASASRSDLVDVENGGTPVGIDTAGNVEQSTYERNRFEEIDGKCIDLDGFHDGAVRANTCINRRGARGLSVRALRHRVQ